MKKNLQLILAAFLVLSITMVSCKKTDTASDNTTELATHADDQSRVSAETDAIANDADVAIESFGAFSGRPGNTSSLLCNAVAVMDSTATDRRITITYNGANCNGTRTRTGTVVLTMPLGTRWRNVGAVLTVNVQNLVVTRIRDNKSLTINGTKTITNSTGGLLIDLASMGMIAHEILSSGITVIFDNGTSRTWQIAKRRVFTYNNGLVITTNGIHTDGTITNISEWGTNRYGTPFVTSITDPLVVRQDCDFRLVSGQVTHQRLAANVVVTFGLDSAGNPATCPGANGTYYLKIVWTGVNGVIRTVIYPY